MLKWPSSHGRLKFHISNLCSIKLLSSCVEVSTEKIWHLQDVSERKIRFTSTHSPKDLSDKIVDIVTEMGLEVQKGHGKVSTLTGFSDTFHIQIDTQNINLLCFLLTVESRNKVQGFKDFTFCCCRGDFLFPVQSFFPMFLMSLC